MPMPDDFYNISQADFATRISNEQTDIFDSLDTNALAEQMSFISKDLKTAMAIRWSSPRAVLEIFAFLDMDKEHFQRQYLNIMTLAARYPKKPGAPASSEPPEAPQFRQMAYLASLIHKIKQVREQTIPSSDLPVQFRTNKKAQYLSALKILTEEQLALTKNKLVTTYDLDVDSAPRAKPSV